MKARIKFSKYGSMKFLGHLDVMRYFQKAFRRSGIDICYSQGFSPHQLISFASPLGVGLTSDGEYFDAELASCASSEEMINILNGEMAEGFKVTDFVLLPEQSKKAMAAIQSADYLVSLKDGYRLCDNFEDKFSSFYKKENIFINKKTKRSEKEVDIKPLIRTIAFSKEDFEQLTGNRTGVLSAEQYENGTKIFMRVSAGSSDNLKPGLVMESFCLEQNVPFDPFAFSVHRIEMYADLETEEGVRQVPLSYFGKKAE